MITLPSLHWVMTPTFQIGDVVTITMDSDDHALFRVLQIAQDERDPRRYFALCSALDDLHCPVGYQVLVLTWQRRRRSAEEYWRIVPDTDSFSLFFRQARKRFRYLVRRQPGSRQGQADG